MVALVTGNGLKKGVWGPVSVLSLDLGVCYPAWLNL